MPLPLQHHRPPLFQQIRPVIRRLYRILYSVRQRPFREIPRVSVLGCPVAEAGPEAVRGSEAARGIALDFLITKELGQHHVSHRLA